MPSGSFINDLYLVTNKMPGLLVLETTMQGNDANLWESSWRSKGKRHIAYTSSDADEYIVTDIKLVPEDKDVDDDYVSVLITKDTCEKGLKKHILYFKKDSRKTANKAVEEVRLVNPSKGEMVPPMFTACPYAINEMLVAFKVGDVPKQQEPALPKVTIPQNLQLNNVPQSPSAMPSVIDLVPFSINPKYNSIQTNDPVISGISIISLDDLHKYDYAFTTEKKVLEESG